LQLPRRLQIEFSQAVQREMDASGKELTAQDLWKLFQAEYRLDATRRPQYRLSGESGTVAISGEFQVHGETRSLNGEGTGPIDAFVGALSEATGRSIRVLNYAEHAVSAGANAQAAAYVELRIDDEHVVYGVGMDANIVSASISAIVSGLERAPRAKEASIA
jgi:2-isopropylmalate synthase